MQAHLPQRRQRGAGRRWWALTGVIGIMGGLLLVTTTLKADGTELRIDSVADLTQVVRTEHARVERLRTNITQLTAEITELTDQVEDADLNVIRDRRQQLRSLLGFTDSHGPGVTVILEDAPKSQIDKAASTEGGVQPSQLIVHQQDIQAVANALWQGGAEAVSIQDQRRIATTGIKCVGNTVVLHGIPYAPPYRISAIGDPQQLLASLENSEYLAAYRSYSEAYELGWEVEEHDDIVLGSSTRSISLRYARAFSSP